MKDQTWVVTSGAAVIGCCTGRWGTFLRSNTSGLVEALVEQVNEKRKPLADALDVVLPGWEQVEEGTCG